MASVGQVPRSPWRKVGPVLVTPAPASTTKGAALPRFTVAGAADADGVPTMPPKAVGNSATPAIKSPTAMRLENR
jgi:hypothetical protein